MAYAFSAWDRVLGFYGHLRVTPRRTLRLDDFLACCTKLGPAAGGGERSFTVSCLRDSGWRLDDERASWQAWSYGPFRIDLILEEGERTRSGFHVALTLGRGLDRLNGHLTMVVPRHRGLLAGHDLAGHQPHAPLIHSRLSQGAARPVTLPTAVCALRGRRLAVYTGAGISAASGIPTFVGSGSLGEWLQFEQPFPGDVVAWMCGDPATLARRFGEFQAQLLIARPNEAHRLLRQLQATGVARHVVTNNIDMLHERAGSGSVVAPSEFMTNATAASDLGALLVIGVSQDVSGVVARCRAAGLVVVVADVEPPVFLQRGDLYVQCDAETLLQALVDDRAPAVLSAPVTPLRARVRSGARRAAPSDVASAIPDFHALLDHVLTRATNAGSEVHGERHWLETAWIALQLSREVPDADAVVALLFAVLHDSQRHDDGHDPLHGHRAARLFEKLPPALLSLSPEQRAHVRVACEAHADGKTTANRTLGVCWDADRLGLWRIGVRPDPQGLSLPISGRTETIDAARAVRGRALSWDELLEEFARL